MTTQNTLALLRRFESRNITHFELDGSWPIVWERASGARVWDAEGRKYLDLTAAFGVAAAGHANPRVVRAGQLQMSRLLHAMGDVHPHALKAQLARELSRLTFERWARIRSREGKNVRFPAQAKTVFCNSGFEAVEVALKTALLATGKPGVIAFTGSYHGTGYGTLSTTHRAHFHAPFQSQLGKFGHFVDFPPATNRAIPGPSGAIEVARRSIEKIARQNEIGAILVEPAQARGGINIPKPEFLRILRRLCDQHGLLLIVDEIFTGFGRTGKWFACEHSGTAVPDLICLGKALTGGFPLSACVGRADVMDAAWPVSTGEAIHTSTFLGHPVGCAMALAQIAELRRERLVERSARLGTRLLQLLQSEISNLKSQIRSLPRGLGLMAGVELLSPDGAPATNEALAVVKGMLHRGFIVLPEGAQANVISFTPPLTITEAQLRSATRAFGNELRRFS